MSITLDVTDTFPIEDTDRRTLDRARHQRSLPGGTMNPGEDRRFLAASTDEEHVMIQPRQPDEERNDAVPAGAIERIAKPTSFIRSKDSTNLFYKDWGEGSPVLFLANWGMGADMWQYQMVPMSTQGVQCVAYDRRGIGRSDQPDQGFDFDTLSDDLAAVIEQLDLRDVTLVGHSMGCCEIVRYLTRHGPSRVARIVLIAPTLPYLMKSADNPDGLDRSLQDEMRAAWLEDFPKWTAEQTLPYFKEGTSPEMMQWVANMTLQTSLKTAMELSYSWSEVDFRAELPKISVPTLLIQGDRDTLPIDLTGRKAAPLIPDCELKVYEGEAHGLMFTSSSRLNDDILEFMRN